MVLHVYKYYSSMPFSPVGWPYLYMQVIQARTKVANGRVFDMAVKLSQGNLPEQIFQVMICVCLDLHVTHASWSQTACFHAFMQVCRYPLPSSQGLSLFDIPCTFTCRGRVIVKVANAGAGGGDARPEEHLCAGELSARQLISLILALFGAMRRLSKPVSRYRDIVQQQQHPASLAMQTAGSVLPVSSMMIRPAALASCISCGPEVLK